MSTNMDKFIIPIIISLFILPISGVYAQENDTIPTNDNKKWINEVKEYKYQMLSQEAQMSDEQMEQFFPLYIEMEKEIFKINSEARKLEMQVSANIDNASDEDFARAAQAMSDTKALEAQVEIKYYPQFAKILSAKQLFLLKRAENHFASNMLKHFNRSQELSAQQK